MSEWSLDLNRAITPVLAADARLSEPDYTNDIVWELRSGNGEPPALAIQTTFGLRARLMRLFPRFWQHEAGLTDPSRFFTAPRLLQYQPDYLAISFQPYPNVTVLAEYRVPASQVLSGRLTLTNQGVTTSAFLLEWVGQFTPLDKGQSMSVAVLGIATILQCHTDSLFPVGYMTGGPQAGNSALPGLALSLELGPQQRRQITWALAALDSRDASFERARQATACAWEAETARITLHNESQSLHITTGDAGWDMALATAQKMAFGLLHQHRGHLPATSFVLSRLPDHGFSRRGDGSDYPYLWNGQTALDSWYLSGFLLPGAPHLAAGLVDNFLHTQHPDGFIDWKPGLAGQRSQHLAQPILASLCRQIAGYLPEPQPWLQKCYPALLSFVRMWFSPRFDPDGDGFPQWNHPVQSGLEDSPVYDYWNAHSQGLEINTLEAPGLAAMLYRECRTLLQMAQEFGYDQDVRWLSERCTTLSQTLQTSWDAGAGIYRYREYLTGASPSGELLVDLNGSGTYQPDVVLPAPQRLVIHLYTHDQNTRAVLLTLQGQTAEGPWRETFSTRHFHWANGRAIITTPCLITAIQQVEIQGLAEKDRCQIRSADYTQEDATLLLPLWAGIPSAEQARILVEDTIQKRFLRPYGLAACPASSSDAVSAPLIWNQLIGEGMLEYGYVTLAADLFTRQMNAILATTTQQQTFRQFYNAETGLPSGERNVLTGLPSPAFFLKICGIEKITQNEVILRNFNPFPWPVTVQYRENTLILRATETVVSFPTGQTVTVTGPGIHRVSLR